MSKLVWKMRIDDYVSTVGLVIRRTEAKRLADSKMIEVNGHSAKPGYQVKADDVIRIKGAKPLTAVVVAIPPGSVAKANRTKFFRLLPAAITQ